MAVAEAERLVLEASLPFGIDEHIFELKGLD